MDARKIDALVAEHVLGCRVAKILDYGVEGNYRYRCDCNGPSPLGTPPHAASDSFDNDIEDYSTDIAAAWQVVERMKVLADTGGSGEWLVLNNANGTYSATFTQDGNYKGIDYASAPTAPLAICIAALRAHGIDAGSF